MVQLNPKQQQAVQTSRGKVLILAGAGSGKTSVIIHRIAHLIQNGTSPEKILGLTFTNKAAEEMRERVALSCGKQVAQKILLCTFHSFCMKVLREDIHHLGYTKEFTLYDEKDIKRIIQAIVREELEHEGELPSLQTTMMLLQKALSSGEIDDSQTDQWHQKFFPKLLVQLRETLRAYNALDFDHLLKLTVDLFEAQPEILKKYQKRFEYVMIDEYQDTNTVQYRIADLISQASGNLCVVGDDDQSIYGWRGAEVEHILRFPAEHTIKLEQNYRSTKNILHAANHVIKKNEKRHAKTLFSQGDDGEPIAVFHAPDDETEAEAVVKRIVFLRTNKLVKWSEIAILYRSNILSRTLEKALLNAVWYEKGKMFRGIPYRVFGGLELYEKAEVKDFFAYLRFLANPQDQEALLRIINYPRRGISDKSLDRLTQYQRTNKLELIKVLEAIQSGELKLDLTQSALNGIDSFLQLMNTAKERFAHSTLAEGAQWLLDELHLKESIAKEVKSERMRQLKWENLQYCIEALASYEEETNTPSLADFMSGILLQTKLKGKKDPLGDHVNLMTFHSSKGLEFPYVFLVALEDHILPHEKSVMDTGLEEERRLFYVAITRAKQKLTLSMAQKRKRHGKVQASAPSQFLFDIPQNLLNVQSWKDSN